VGFGNVTQRQHGTTASVGEQHIQAPLFLSDAGVEFVQLLQPGGVDRNTGGIANLRHSLVQLSLATPGDVDMGTLLCKAFCRGQADAGGAAGDQCDLAFEFLAHGVSPVEMVSSCREKRID